MEFVCAHHYVTHHSFLLSVIVVLLHHISNILRNEHAILLEKYYKHIDLRICRVGMSYVTCRNKMHEENCISE